MEDEVKHNPQPTNAPAGPSDAAAQAPASPTPNSAATPKRRHGTHKRIGVSRSPADKAAALKAISRLRDEQDVRAALVEAVRASINDKQYINELKLAVAAERLAADLARVQLLPKRTPR
ncbi:MAG: hypothetical protein ACFCVE_11615 [Phycisphaerae bacterium]